MGGVEGKGGGGGDGYKQEVKEAIKRLKDGKTLGRDTWGRVEISRGRSRELDLGML